MNAHNHEQAAVPQTQHNLSKVFTLEREELLTRPAGTFAGTQDCVMRFRNGQPITADTGDQGGGQNRRVAGVTQLMQSLTNFSKVDLDVELSIAFTSAGALVYQWRNRLLH